MSTTSAGKSIKEVIDISSNERLRIKLSTAINSSDVHAIDIKYHSKCYVNNVTNVLRQSKFISNRDNSNTAAKMKFIDITESTQRKLLNIANVKALYTNILRENGMPSPSCSRKMLKQLVLTEIPDVEFNRPTYMNKPGFLTVKRTGDESVLESSEDVFIKENEFIMLHWFLENASTNQRNGFLEVNLMT